MKERFTFLPRSNLTRQEGGGGGGTQGREGGRGRRGVEGKGKLGTTCLSVNPFCYERKKERKKEKAVCVAVRWRHRLCLLKLVSIMSPASINFFLTRFPSFLLPVGNASFQSLVRVAPCQT